jgi:hypothetical protein
MFHSQTSHEYRAPLMTVEFAKMGKMPQGAARVVENNDN